MPRFSLSEYELETMVSPKKLASIAKALKVGRTLAPPPTPKIGCVME